MTERGLKFYPKSHKYRLDGKWVPGVTTLISNGLPKKALVYWSARTVAEYVADNPDGVEQLRTMGRGPMVAALKETPWQKRDEAAVRGTDVHNLAERLANGEQVEVPDHLVGHVESCVRFLDDWRIEPLVAERPVAHRRWWYAGTPDLIGRLPDGRVAIVDWKTNASGIYPEVSLQLAAYAHAEFYLAPDGAEQPVPACDVGLGVWLRADGYDVYELNIGESAFAMFNHVAYVARTAEEMKAWKSEALPKPANEVAA